MSRRALGLLALEYRRRQLQRRQQGLAAALAAEDTTLSWSLGLGA